MRTIGSLSVSPLCLGGNVFGWTVDRDGAFAVLDAYVAAGGNFLDTADAYPPPPSGLEPGGSEEIIGEWMEARGNRDRIVIATKVGVRKGHVGLSPAQVREGIEGSLRRLRTDRIDLYYAHSDDPATPLEETLQVFDALVREGKVRETAASNYATGRLAEGLAISAREGFARWAAIQPHYNLLERAYEHDERAVCEREGIACVPYWGLASGFLTGKYRLGAANPDDNVRRQRAATYLDDPRAGAVLAALDATAAAHGTTVGAVALAWLYAQPTVVAPIASARTVAQIGELMAFPDVALTAAELDALDRASQLS